MRGRFTFGSGAESPVPSRTPTGQTTTTGPFTTAAVPAVDGIGDPQVSWAVEAGGKRVIHLGDSVFHGYWWRAAHRYGPFDAVLPPSTDRPCAFRTARRRAPNPAPWTSGRRP